MVSVLWSALNYAMPALAGLIIFSLCSRVLSPSEFGLVALAASIALFSGGFTPAGFGDALIQREEIDELHLDTLFWLCGATAAIVYAALVALALPLGQWFDDDRLPLLLMLCGSRVVADSLAVVPNAIFARTMRFNLLALRTTIASIASALSCLLLLSLGWGIWALAVSYVASSIVGAIVALISVSWRPRLRVSRNALRQLWNVGIFSSLNRFLQVLNAEQILVGALLGTTALGLYSFSRRIFQIVNDLIAGALNSVSFALLSSLQSERDKLKDAFLLVTFISAAVTFPIFLGIAAVGDQLIPIAFGDQWASAVPILQIFCLIGLLSSIGILQASLIGSHGRTDWWLYYQASQQLGTVALVLLTYPYGVHVMVAAIAIKTLMLFPISVRLCLMIVDVKHITYLKRLLGPTTAGAALLASVWLARHFTSGNVDPILQLAAMIASGGLAYIATLAIVSKKELIQIRTMVASRRRP
ncbi:lipopolysaccharide biosynthesis protein [Ciceribacter sp. L1K23]|uniref:lipopolysaccharide biosynthesis protein n=1 Tax=Ciceribacter sp. L1K23 TaxID=2820276 RepID=UPI001B8194E6|nr:lipopolysaccharide biosynthesis protein [Ciceribacter sp. L1K23]MBR0557929.1 lipopolysaccharide biosynthesis protein [Ciceribacter sp. L1K23]